MGVGLYLSFKELMLKKRQIVRLVVQSPQNMNDPAVKADILEKVSVHSWTTLLLVALEVLLDVIPGESFNF